jgi:hypothetical protein
MALSFTKFKFKTFIEVAKEGYWLMDLLVEHDMISVSIIPIHYDNGSCIKDHKDLIYHSKTKTFHHPPQVHTTT